MDQTKIRRKLTGDRNQCPSCGEFFNSTFAFEKHMHGRVATSDRRCKTIHEMTVAGMVKNAHDFWVSSENPNKFKEA